MLVIPAIDLLDGECVRLVQGDVKRKTVFSSSPLITARHWEGLGARMLHVVDLNGALEGEPKNLKLAAKIAEDVHIPVQFGGGIRSPEVVDKVLTSGIQRVVIGTLAVEKPDLVKALCRKYPGRIVLGIDARDGLVAVRGWREASTLPAVRLAKIFETCGMRGIVFTDIRRDGTLEGPNIPRIKELVESTYLPVMAAGGISRLEDIEAIAKEVPQVVGVITGMAIYTGVLDFAEAVRRIQSMSSGG